jgi:putative CocE/NonD family hydrolase
MAITVRTDLPQHGLSAPRFDRVRVVHGLTVEARDGTTLCLDLLRPDADGAFPVVLIRTPYDKVSLRELREGAKDGLPYDHEFVYGLVRRGYIVAFADVRGRFNSDGDWHPYVHEADDGHDTIEWIAAQPWCDGSIGMIGRSYVGYTQWAAAVSRPTGLKAIVPIGAQPDLFASGFPIMNGVFNLPMAELLVAMGRRSFQIRDFMANVMHETHGYFDTLPIADIPRNADTAVPAWWDEMMAHPTRDEYWLRGSYREQLDGFDIPVMNISGWYDLTLHGALENYREVCARGDASEQRLVMGPWAHWADTSAGNERIDFGPTAVGGLGPHITRFLDHWVKGEENALEDDARVQLFAMGANEWWTAPTWPLPTTAFVPFYLQAGGGLSTERPAADEAPDTYRYDPLDPVTGPWSMHNGPVDDSQVLERDDVLCYTSEPLDEPLDVAGPLSFVLHAASSAPDTDWHVRLVDVHPDGYAQFLAHGVLRARFRESFERPTLLTPGQVERFEIDLTGTANRFLPGHRIRIELTSSWFPRYDRNLNTGAENPFLDASPVVAEQTVHHDAEQATYVVLPIVSV